MEKELIRSNEAKRITLFGFWVNAVLSGFKIFAGLIGNSAAMLADGIHSLSDFLTDIVVLIGFKMTAKPEDECHNYGHDKYETLATLMISGFLFFVGFNILKSGIIQIIGVMNGEIIPKPKLIAFIAAIISIVTKEILFKCTIKVGNTINSSALTANAWHHRSDALSSIGTLVGIGGAIILGQNWTILDPIASVIVSVFIFKVAINILVPAVNELMESSLEETKIEKIKFLISKHPDVLDYHQLRTRRIGSKVAVEFHILVLKSMDVISAHNIASEIEKEIRGILGESSIVTIHIEPYVQEEIK